MDRRAGVNDWQQAKRKERGRAEVPVYATTDTSGGPHAYYYRKQRERVCVFPFQTNKLKATHPPPFNGGSGAVQSKK
jgi:hypothetical protein